MQLYIKKLLRQSGLARVIFHDWTGTYHYQNYIGSCGIMFNQHKRNAIVLLNNANSRVIRDSWPRSLLKGMWRTLTLHDNEKHFAQVFYIRYSVFINELNLHGCVVRSFRELYKFSACSRTPALLRVKRAVSHRWAQRWGHLTRVHAEDTSFTCKRVCGLTEYLTV